MVAYDSSLGDFEEWEMFWNDLDRVVDRLGNRYNLCELGELNRWVGDRMRAA